MMYNIFQDSKETVQLLNIMDNIVSVGLGYPGVEVVRVKRCAGNPGPVKVELELENIKMDLLKAKGSLKDKRQYSQIYIRSSKSHESRLMELNMKTLLDELNMSQTFRFTGNGRMLRKDAAAHRSQYSDGAEGGPGHGGGGPGRGFGGHFICLSETHLRGNGVIHLNGYTWFGNNRTNLHVQAI